MPGGRSEIFTSLLGRVSKVPPVPRLLARHSPSLRLGKSPRAALSNRPSCPLRGRLSVLRCTGPDAAGPVLRAAGATFGTRLVGADRRDELGDAVLFQMAGNVRLADHADQPVRGVVDHRQPADPG